MEKKQKKILVVDDEMKIVDAISAYLEHSGYVVLKAYDGETAMLLFEQQNPDLIILDLMLPKISGEEICKSIRRKSRIPIIMLTAKIEEDDKITGLNIGADDYITKPFSPGELVARVNVLFRRIEKESQPLFQKMSWNHNDLEINLIERSVKKAGNIINLTPNEYKLLYAFVTFPNKIFTREELMETAFGMEYEGYERTVDSHIKNLRGKIEDDTTNPNYIITIRGVGYKFGE